MPSTFPRISIQAVFNSAGFWPLNCCCKPSRDVLRPSPVAKSSTTALTSGLVPVSIFAFASIFPLAKLSSSRPQSPCGSAAVTASPAAITLSRRVFHSSDVKLDLSAMRLLLACLFQSAGGRKLLQGAGQCPRHAGNTLGSRYHRRDAISRCLSSHHYG